MQARAARPLPALVINVEASMSDIGIQTQLPAVPLRPISPLSPTVRRSASPFSDQLDAIIERSQHSIEADDDKWSKNIAASDMEVAEVDKVAQSPSQPHQKDPKQLGRKQTVQFSCNPIDSGEGVGLAPKVFHPRQTLSHPPAITRGSSTIPIDLSPNTSVFHRRIVSLCDTELHLMLDSHHIFSNLLGGPALTKFVIGSILKRFGRLFQLMYSLSAPMFFCAILYPSIWTSCLFMSLGAFGIIHQICMCLMLQIDIVKMALTHFESLFLIFNTFVCILTFFDMLNWPLYSIIAVPYFALSAITIFLVDAFPISFSQFEENIKEIRHEKQKKKEVTEYRSNSDSFDDMEENVIGLNELESSHGVSHLQVPGKPPDSYESNPIDELSNDTVVSKSYNPENNKESADVSLFSWVSDQNYVRMICRNLYLTLSQTQSKSGLRNFLWKFQIIRLHGSATIMTLFLATMIPVAIYFFVQFKVAPNLNARQFRILNSIITTDAICRSCCINMGFFNFRRLVSTFIYPLKMHCVSRRMMKVPLVLTWENILRNKKEPESFQNLERMKSQYENYSLNEVRDVKRMKSMKNSFYGNKRKSATSSFVNRRSVVSPSDSPIEHRIARFKKGSQVSVIMSRNSIFSSRGSIFANSSNQLVAIPGAASLTSAQDNTCENENERAEPPNRRSSNHVEPPHRYNTGHGLSNLSKYIPKSPTNMSISSEQPSSSAAGGNSATGRSSRLELKNSTIELAAPETHNNRTGSLFHRVQTFRSNRIESISSRRSSVSRAVYWKGFTFEDYTFDRRNNSLSQLPPLTENARFYVISTPMNDQTTMDYTKTFGEILFGWNKRNILNRLSHFVFGWFQVIWALSLITVLISFVSGDQGFLYFACFVIPLGIFHQLCFLSLYSINPTLMALKSFETIFLLGNSIVCCIGLGEYMRWEGYQVWIGVPLLLLSFLSGSLIDGQPISFLRFSKELRQLHEQQMLGENDVFSYMNPITDVTQLVKRHVIKSVKRERKDWDGFKIEECYNNPKSYDDNISFKEKLRVKWHILSLFSHSTWTSMTIVLITIFSLMVMIQFDVVLNHKQQIIHLTIATYSLDALIRISLFNMGLIFLKRIMANIVDPFRSATIERRVIKMPLATRLCELDDNIV